MKKNLMLITVVLTSFLNCANPQNKLKVNDIKKQEENKEIDGVSIKSLSNVDLHRYIGRQVSELLSDSIISKYKDYIFIQGKPGLLLYLSLEYSRNLHVEVIVNNYRYTKQFDVKMAWKLSSFKNEKIGQIKIKVDNRIIKDIK